MYVCLRMRASERRPRQPDDRDRLATKHVDLRDSYLFWRKDLLVLLYLILPLNYFNFYMNNEMRLNVLEQENDVIVIRKC